MPQQQSRWPKGQSVGDETSECYLKDIQALWRWGHKLQDSRKHWKSLRFQLSVEAGGNFGTYVIKTTQEPETPEL